MTTTSDFADIIPQEDQRQAILEAHVPTPVFLQLAWTSGVERGHGPNVRFTGLGLPTVPAGTKAENAAPGHRFHHLLTGVGGLEGVDGLDVLEHERQVEDAEHLGELLELGQRGRGHLHVAVQHCLEHLVVVVECRVRVDLHAGLAVHLLVDALLQQRRGDALGVLVGVGDVAELDDHLAFVAIRECGAGGRGQGRHGSGGQQKLLHGVLPERR